MIHQLARLTSADEQTTVCGLTGDEAVRMEWEQTTCPDCLKAVIRSARASLDALKQTVGHVAEDYMDADIAHGDTEYAMSILRSILVESKESLDAKDAARDRLLAAFNELKGIHEQYRAAVEPLCEQNADLKASRDAKDAQIARLTADNANWQETVEFQSKEYLAAHGGSWGLCKYQAENAGLRASLEAAQRDTVSNATPDTAKPWHCHLCGRPAGAFTDKHWVCADTVSCLAARSAPPAPTTCTTCGELATRGRRCLNPFHVTGDPAWDMHGTPGMPGDAAAPSEPPTVLERDPDTGLLTEASAALLDQAIDRGELVSLRKLVEELSEDAMKWRTHVAAPAPSETPTPRTFPVYFTPPGADEFNIGGALADGEVLAWLASEDEVQHDGYRYVALGPYTRAALSRIVAANVSAPAPAPDVAKQEELVSALHHLVRETLHSLSDVTTRSAHGEYDWNQAAMLRAIARIMGLFGYTVTEIQ